MTRIIAAALIMSSAQVGVITAADNDMRDITTMELIGEMGVGINLGNTFESCGDWISQWGDGSVKSYETAWGSPVVTEKMIKGYAEAGFETLRVPIAWSNLMSDDGKYTISSDYMARVTEVVNWALDSDMYVIVNLHWDGGWIDKLPEDHDQVMEKYEAIWVQIADNFKEYGDHLIFESQNEELGWSSLWNEWGGLDGKDESFAYANEMNQKFVDIIRNSGGNNGERHLLISGYNTSIKHTCDPLFKMPNDPANRCAVSVHYYSPASFAILTEDADWGKASPTWGTDQEYADLDSEMELLKKTYVDNGIPVIIGEFGCPKENKEIESVNRFLPAVCETALSKGGICPVLWDVTNLHYDRGSYKMTDETLHQALLDVKSKYIPEDVEGDVNSDGEFSIADVVALQKWLLTDPESDFVNWENADMCKDGIIDVYDFCEMMSRLVK